VVWKLVGLTVGDSWRMTPLKTPWIQAQQKPNLLYSISLLYDDSISILGDDLILNTMELVSIVFGRHPVYDYYGNSGYR
jgi:hypothetical protein